MKRILLSITAVAALSLFAVPAMANDFDHRGPRDIQTVAHRRHWDHHGHRGWGYDHHRPRHHYRHGYSGRSSWGYPGYGRRDYCPPSRYGYGHRHGGFNIYGRNFGFGIGW